MVEQQALLPEHHSASNRLQPGALQQAPHTALLLDETREPPEVTKAPLAAHEARYGKHLHALEAFVRDGVLECAYAFQQVSTAADLEPASSAVLYV